MKVGLLAIFLFLTACGSAPTTLPTSTATLTPLPTLIPTATSSPTPVPTPTFTPEPAWYQRIDASYGMLKYRYGEVRNPRARVYLTFEDALQRNGNFGHLPNTPADVAIVDVETRDGKTYYSTLLGWMSAEDVRLVSPSAYRGILLTRQVTFRFGWVLQETQSVNSAGIPVRTYSRYDIVHDVPAGTGFSGYFAVGPDEWLPLASLAVIDPALPADAGTCRFLYVDLSQQTLKVFDDCKLVFATLVSTGKDPRWTFPGRFTVLYKVINTQLSPPPESISVYYLQGVPYFITYYGDLGFHGAYWHDDFGKAVSHGCINLSPADAKWLYEWTREGDIVLIRRPGAP